MAYQGEDTNIEAFKLLLADRRTNPNISTNYGAFWRRITPLGLAIDSEQLDMVRALVADERLDINDRIDNHGNSSGVDGLTAAMYAIEANGRYVRNFLDLIFARPDFDPTVQSFLEGHGLLQFSARNIENEELMDFIFRSTGLDLNQSDKTGWTAIFRANDNIFHYFANHSEIAINLVIKTEGYKNTILTHMIREHRHLAVIQLLHNEHLDANLPDKAAFHLVATFMLDRPEVMSALLNRDEILPSIQNHQDGTPIEEMSKRLYDSNLEARLQSLQLALQDERFAINAWCRKTSTGHTYFHSALYEILRSGRIEGAKMILAREDLRIDPNDISFYEMGMMGGELVDLLTQNPTFIEAVRANSLLKARIPQVFMKLLSTIENFPMHVQLDSACDDVDKYPLHELMYEFPRGLNLEQVATLFAATNGNYVDLDDADHTILTKFLYWRPGSNPVDQHAFKYLATLPGLDVNHHVKSFNRTTALHIAGFRDATAETVRTLLSIPGVNPCVYDARANWPSGLASGEVREILLDAEAAAGCQAASPMVGF